MKFEFSKEEQLLQSSAKDFAKKYLSEISFAIDKTGEYPAEAVAEMAKANYLGITIPAEFGGLGLDARSLAVVSEAIGYECASAGAILMAHLGLTAEAITKYGKDSVKAEYLPKLAKGEIIGGYAVAEVGASVGYGEDKLVAKEDGDAYVLNGKKYYVANGGVAGVYVAYAITDEEAGAKSLTGFVVDAAAEGVTVEADIDKLGLRSFKTATVSFKDVKVSKENMLGEVGAGKAIVADIKAFAEIIDGAIAVGVAKNACDSSLSHSQTRIQFGGPIGRLQAVAELVATMNSATYAVESVVYRAASTYAAGGNYVLESAMVKSVSTRLCFEVVMNAVQIHGGVGYSREAHIERLFRDMKGLSIKEDMSEVAEAIIYKNINK